MPLDELHAGAVAGIVDRVVTRYRHDPTCIVQILREVQEACDWIPPEAIDRMQTTLGVPRTKIEGVAGFYSFFHTQPRGKYRVLFSDNITDRMLGSKALMDRLCNNLWIERGKVSEDGLVSVGQTACTGMCDQGPALLVNNYAVAGLTAARISNFRPWEAVEWFTNAAHRILLSEFTNGLPFLPQGLSSYVPGLGIHGAVVETNGNRRYLTNYSYDARVHRAMQVAANIYDGANNRFLGQGAEQINPPSVFRPIVYEDSRSPGILRLHGYQEILGGTPAFLTNRPWVTLDQATNLLDLSRPEENKTSRDAFNVFGIPWVVGAKKGLPNFNQALWQTVIQPTRRLVIRRPNRSSKISASELPFSGANGSGFRTEYQYLINVTNLVGLEAWNSYSKEFSRNVTVFANNMLEFSLRDETGGVLNRDPLVQRTEFLSFEMVTNRWAAREYVAPGVGSAQSFQRSPGFIQRPNNIGNAAVAVPGGIAISSSFIYDPARHLALPPSRTNEGWVVVSQGNRDLLAPVLSVYVTNSLIFSITDRASGRLLDFVTLLNTNLEILEVQRLHTLVQESVAVGVIKGHWRVKRTSIEVRATAANLFTFAAGKIQSYTVLNNTAAFLEALSTSQSV